MMVLALGLAPWFAPGRALADRIAVAPPRLSGGNATLATALRASIAGGIAASGHEAVDAAAVDQVLGSTAGCDTDVCLAHLAERVGARAAVRALIEVLGTSNYTFRLELVDAAARRTVARLEDGCPICTAREAHEAISRAGAALGRRLHSASAAPVATTVAAAPTIVAEPSRPWQPRARLLLGLGVTSTVLGAGALAGGAALIALDGVRIDTDPMTGDPIRHAFPGKIPGAVLVAGGGLLVLGGGILIWRATLARRLR
jgi:hypothetical protein